MWFLWCKWFGGGRNLAWDFACILFSLAWEAAGYVLAFIGLVWIASLFRGA